MSTCIHYTNNRDDAAAFVNEAFLKIITNIDKVDTEKPLDQWMRKIAVNCIIDHFRKRNQKEVKLEDNKYAEKGVNNGVEQVIEQEFIDNLLDILPQKTKLVVNLHYREGYAHSEIAQMLGISIETSKWHIKSARKLLRKIKIAN